MLSPKVETYKVKYRYLKLLWIRQHCGWLNSKGSHLEPFQNLETLITRYLMWDDVTLVQKHLCVHKILASKVYISNIAWQHFLKFLSIKNFRVLTEKYVALNEIFCWIRSGWRLVTKKTINPRTSACINADHSLIIMCFIIDFFRAKHL